MTSPRMASGADHEALHASISQCMASDQHALRQRARVLANDAAGIDRLSEDIARSAHQRQMRVQNLPRPDYPPDLPIVQRRDEIIRAIAANQVVIVCGETGSGKSTQLPKMCLEAGRGVGGMIGHTQPRRIAARTIAMRIASELQSAVGHAVGYKVRFNDRISRDSYIKVMTDGILLAETQRDRYLTQYDMIIVDEAHERSLNIDFLLGYLKQLIAKRPDLKVIITSATIDPKRFSSHFNDAPIIEVSGRTFPVELLYKPVQAEEADEDDPTLLDAIVRAVDELVSAEVADVKFNQARDILIFLSGEREIRETVEALEKRHHADTEILPLYARLSWEEQNRVFQPMAKGKTRRIVLATNVAETSLTVPGIRYVIDPGLAQISRYSPNARVQRLPIERISRASADQRKGRCGRIGPGCCIRLYSEDDFAQREAFTDPEILRANLANVILQMKALKLGSIEQFPFIDPPRPAMIREGYQTLLELGAITEPGDRGRLTRIGSELAKWPVDPRIARMILAARQEKCLHEVLIIASALATQDPRVRPMDNQMAADAAHLPFVDESSDFLSYLKLWEYFHQHARELSNSKLRKTCQVSFLSYLRFREWHDVHQQLHAMVTEGGIKVNDVAAPLPAIHRALLSGLLNTIGNKTATHEYLGPRERRFNIFPGSGLFKKPPKWVMAAELVETTRLYARTVARIHPEWIERVGSHLIKRSHSEPHWNEKSAHVEAYERLSLHGLVIVPKRRIHYGPVNPAEAREIFIRQGIVEGALPLQMRTAEFLAHNRRMIDQRRATEAKLRRRDALATEDAAFDFYNSIIPASVYDGPSFEKWRRTAERDSPHILHMRANSLATSQSIADADQYPEFRSLDGVRVPLTYTFDPGGSMDGVTATVPIEAINQISERAVEWLVPGFLVEKVTELIRSLPKTLRREFVPAPEISAAAVRALPFGDGDLREQLGSQLHRIGGVAVPADAWKPEQIPDYLRMNINVVDLGGKIVAGGRDLTLIKQTVHQNASGRIGESSPTRESGFMVSPAITSADAAAVPMDVSYTEWSFGDLPRSIEMRRGEFTVRGFPALCDQGHSVSIQIQDSEAASFTAHREGLRRLFWLHVHDELRVHIEYLPNIDDLTLLFSPLGDGDTFKRDLADLVIDRVFIGENAEVFTKTEFERRLRSGWAELWPLTSQMADLLGRILANHHSIELQLDDAISSRAGIAIDDIRMQLSYLLPPHFMVQIPLKWLEHYPRYLAAILQRLRKLAAGHVQRDAQFVKEIEPHWKRYEAMARHHAIHRTADPELDIYRWMIEEFRVSLFAQELGTSVPVSAKRLDAQWTKVKR